MTRGRSIDQTLPLTRALAVQRAYRARKAENIKRLEQIIERLTMENEDLRAQISQIQQCPNCLSLSSSSHHPIIPIHTPTHDPTSGDEILRPLELVTQVKLSDLDVLDSVREEMCGILCKLEEFQRSARGEKSLDEHVNGSGIGIGSMSGDGNDTRRERGSCAGEKVKKNKKSNNVGRTKCCGDQQKACGERRVSEDENRESSTRQGEQQQQRQYFHHLTADSSVRSIIPLSPVEQENRRPSDSFQRDINNQPLTVTLFPPLPENEDAIAIPSSMEENLHTQHPQHHRQQEREQHHHHYHQQHRHQDRRTLVIEASEPDENICCFGVVDCGPGPFA